MAGRGLGKNVDGDDGQRQGDEGDSVWAGQEGKKRDIRSKVYYCTVATIYMSPKANRDQQETNKIKEHGGARQSMMRVNDSRMSGQK